MVTVTSPYKKSAVRKFCTITNIVKAFTSSSLDAIINNGVRDWVDYKVVYKF